VHIIKTVVVFLILCPLQFLQLVYFNTTWTILVPCDELAEEFDDRKKNIDELAEEFDDRKKNIVIFQRRR
jgi:hypothetical protein